jgi:phosphoribosylanthranilate isomerase
VIIKANHITNLTDARYFAAKEVDALSFNFVEGSEHFIDPMRAKAMFEWVAVPRIFGIFDNLSAEDIQFLATGYGIQHIQVGENTAPETIFDIQVAAIIKEIRIDSTITADILRGYLKTFPPQVEAFELNFIHAELSWQRLKKAEWAIRLSDLESLCRDFKLLLAIPFEPEDWQDIEALNPYGICLQGGDEEKIGIKSFEALDDIFEALSVNRNTPSVFA